MGSGSGDPHLAYQSKKAPPKRGLIVRRYSQPSLFFVLPALLLVLVALLLFLLLLLLLVASAPLLLTTLVLLGTLIALLGHLGSPEAAGGMPRSGSCCAGDG